MRQSNGDRCDGVAALLAAHDLGLSFLDVWDGDGQTAAGETLLDWARRIHGSQAKLMVDAFELLMTWDSAAPYVVLQRCDSSAPVGLPPFLRTSGA